MRINRIDHDTYILCRDCGENFLFTVQEHRFLIQKFGSESRVPTRCAPCRKKRRQGVLPTKLRTQTEDDYDAVWKD